MTVLALVARRVLGGCLLATLGLAAAAEPPAPAPFHPAFASQAAPPLAPALALRPVARSGYLPPARWDGREGAAAWTRAAMRAVESDPRGLPGLVPADVAAWCPGYARNPAHLRAAFWVGTLSALARHESGFDPRAAGGGGSWFGLMQISPATARFNGCEAEGGEALRDGGANVACAVRIAARAVARDGVVASGRGGLAADWGPMRREGPREDVRAWVRAQPYCEVETAVTASLRPVARPLPVLALN